MGCHRRSKSNSHVTYTIENGAVLDVSAARFYIYTTTAQNAFGSSSGGTNTQTITFNINGTLKLGSAVELVCAYATNHIYMNVGATGKVLGTSTAADDVTNRSSKQASTPVTISSPTLTLGTYSLSTVAGSGYLTGFTGVATYTAPLGFVGGTCTKNPQGVATWTVASGGFTSYTIVDAGTCTVAPTSAVATGMSNVPGAWFAMASSATISGRLSGTTAKTFWVGISNTVYNPVTITNGGSGATAMAQIKVAAGNTPLLNSNNLGIAVTWDIHPDPNTSGATITNTFDLTLGYNDNQANGGCTPSASMQLGHYTGSAWEQLGSLAIPTTGSGTDRKVSFSDFTLTSFSPFAIGNAGVLPVKFQNIAAKSYGASNVIAWTTANEKDNAYFTIERSNDGISFSNIGTVKGNGTTSVERNYIFTDNTPLSKNYYRVRQTDNNGASTVSKTVAVLKDEATAARFYPSVPKGDLTIELANDVFANVHISNVMGQTVWSKKGLTGINQLTINHLPTGTYFLTIAQGGVVSTKKLVKQH